MQKETLNMHYLMHFNNVCLVHTTSSQIEICEIFCIVEKLKFNFTHLFFKFSVAL